MGDFKDQLTDLTGKHIESFIALLVKALPGDLGNFGVGHKLNVEGDDYRYYFVLAREDHPAFDVLENQYQDVRDKVNKTTETDTT